MNVGDAVRKGGEGQETGPRSSQQNVAMLPQQYPFAMGISVS